MRARHMRKRDMNLSSVYWIKLQSDTHQRIATLFME